MRSSSLSIALLVVAPLSLAAQVGNKDSWHLSLATGPTGLLHSGMVFWGTKDGKPLAGATDGEFHIALGAQRPIPRSNLTFRMELLYNRGSTAPNSWLVLEHSTEMARLALRDESFGILAGLNWSAFNDRWWTPYLVTGAGWYRNRLGTNPDDHADWVSDSYSTNTIGVNAGVGLRVTLWHRQWFAEARRHLRLGRNVTDFVPLSLGVVF